MVGFWYRDGGKVGRSCIVNTRCMLDIVVSREAMDTIFELRTYKLSSVVEVKR